MPIETLPTFEQMRDVETVPAPEPTPAPSPTEQATPEPIESGEAPAPPEAPRPVETVPLAVHLRQRDRMERELAQLREQHAIGQQRLEALYAQSQQPQAQPPGQDDPLGQLIYNQNMLAQSIGAVQESIQRRDQQDLQTVQLQRTTQAIRQDEARFAQSKPDYEKAVGWLFEHRVKGHMAIGMTREQAEGEVQHETGLLIRHAVNNSISPAEAAYNLAQTWGYRPAYGGAALAPDEVVGMRQQGARMAAPAGGSATPPGRYSYAQLASMSNDEFAKLTKGENWKKMVGE